MLDMLKIVNRGSGRSRPAPDGAVVVLQRVTKTYGKGASAVHALREVTVALPRGSFTAVMGPSGSGKSTLMHCAAGLDRPTGGTVWLGEVELTALREPDLTRLRRQRVGFVFQAFNLLPSLTAVQNVTLPVRLAGVRPDPAWLRQVLDRVGLTGRAGHRPAQLSGGQQQRVAVVFADEPTGALDTRTGRTVLGLLRQVVDELGQTVVMVTHDPVAAAYADRVLFLADGRFVGELADPTATRIAERMTRLDVGSEQPAIPDQQGRA
jgi:putative ABC transport system ATP-binding protein